MVTSRRRQGAAGRASERGPDPKRRTVGPGAGAAELVAGGSALDFGAWSSRGEGGGGEGWGGEGKTELEQAQCSKRRTRLIRELQPPKDACADSAHEQSG